jgi:hypothetical protein
MKPADLAKLVYDPSEILRAAGFPPDKWQRDFLRSHHPQTLLNITRQGGKSRATSAKAIHTALFNPNSTTLILSPGQRQSSEIFHKVLEAYNAVGRPVKATYETQLKLELANGARIICLPGKEETVRCYSPELIIIDEASRVPDDLYRAVRPMLTMTKGQLIALSTPFGQRGWFYHAWQSRGHEWQKIKVPANEHPRISPSFLATELSAMGQAYMDQEYYCLFTAMAGLVYPAIETCYAPIDPARIGGHRCGGIDWGWRNPFAAIWGALELDHLYIYGERYLRQTPLHDHAAALPRITWYADPAGRTEIEEMRIAGHLVRRAQNNIRPGIAAITARIRDKRITIDPARCPNLAAEAALYRYPDDKERNLYGENPIDDNNHALGALRYLISRIDSRYIAKLRHTTDDAPPQEEEPTPQSRPAPASSRLADYFDQDDYQWTTAN